MPCKALILVGGYGTRLRPFTFDLPKPLVPFANKAIVMHQIHALVAVGVTEVVLAVSEKSEIMAEYLSEQAKTLGISIIISKEDIPLGTAGPLSLARAHLEGTDPFFVLNSDVICDFPFADILRFHKSHGKQGTIFVTKVQDPTKYGVVVADPKTGCIQKFVEKPTEFVGDLINAGIYVFTPGILDRIKPVPTSIERETFPAMAKEGHLFQYVLPGFWMDIGQPKDYLSGQVLYLQSLRSARADQLATGTYLIGNNIVHPSAKIGKHCRIGPDVVIGANVVIGDNVCIERSAIFEGTKIGSGAFVGFSIIGWHCNLGQWSHLDRSCFLGKDVTIGEKTFLVDVRIAPHKGVKENVLVGHDIM